MMNTNLLYDFSVNENEKSITVKRAFAAKRSDVWDAYTKSKILDLWWAPKPWKARTKTMDFREGGHWIYAMVGPNGEEHWGREDYLSIQFQEKFTGRDAFSDAEGNVNINLPQSTWEMIFTDQGQNTLMEFHIVYNDLAQLETTIQMGFKEGLSMAMEGLDELLAQRTKI